MTILPFLGNLGKWGLQAVGTPLLVEDLATQQELNPIDAPAGVAEAALLRNVGTKTMLPQTLGTLAKGVRAASVPLMALDMMGPVSPQYPEFTDTDIATLTSLAEAGYPLDENTILTLQYEGLLRDPGWLAQWGVTPGGNDTTNTPSVAQPEEQSYVAPDTSMGRWRMLESGGVSNPPTTIIPKAPPRPQLMTQPHRPAAPIVPTESYQTQYQRAYGAPYVSHLNRLGTQMEMNSAVARSNKDLMNATQRTSVSEMLAASANRAQNRLPNRLPSEPVVPATANVYRRLPPPNLKPIRRAGS